MTTGEIKYAVADGVCVIRMEGRLTHVLGVSFGLFIDRLFEQDSVKDVVLDFEKAQYLDSTMLGLLGKMANYLHRRAHRKATVVGACENVRQLLTSIGFDDVFVMSDGKVSADAGHKCIPEAEIPDGDRIRIIRDAHKTLMDMNDANAVRFRSVVELLDKEMTSASK